MIQQDPGQTNGIPHDRPFIPGDQTFLGNHNHLPEGLPDAWWSTEKGEKPKRLQGSNVGFSDKKGGHDG